MSLNKILPIHKACLTGKGAFKAYGRVHVSKGRAMATNGSIIVVWNLAKLQQVGEKDEEEEVLTEEVIEFLEGKSITSQYWEALVNAKEAFVVKDGNGKNLEIIQEGRDFTLSYHQPEAKAVYIDQIAKMVKLEAEISKTEKSCFSWNDLEVIKKALGVSATTKMNFVFNGVTGAVKVVPENGFDCFAICKSINNETNLFVLEEFNEFVKDFLTVGDSFSVKIGAVQKEKEAKKEEPVDKAQTNLLDDDNKDGVLDIVGEDDDELPT